MPLVSHRRCAQGRARPTRRRPYRAFPATSRATSGGRPGHCRQRTGESTPDGDAPPPRPEWTLSCSDGSVDLFEAPQKARHRAGADGNMSADLRHLSCRSSPGTTRTRSFVSGSSTHSRSSGSISQKRRWISRMPSLVSARPFRPPPSIHFWTVICAFASSCRSRLRASLL